MSVPAQDGECGYQRLRSDLEGLTGDGALLGPLSPLVTHQAGEGSVAKAADLVGLRSPQYLHTPTEGSLCNGTPPLLISLEHWLPTT